MVKNNTGPVKVASNWCKGCGICVEFCSKDVLSFDNQGKAEVKKPDECNSCKQCELRCPDFAIVVNGGDTK